MSTHIPSTESNIDPNAEVLTLLKNRGGLPYDERDGKIHVKANLKIYASDLIDGRLPDLSRVVLDGDFICSELGLTSLKGAPQEIIGNFDCSNNKLSELNGGPTVMRGNYDCSYNELVKLKGAPTEVSGNFHCHRNQLANLAEAPQKVGGDFLCYYNQLTSLMGGPLEVGEGQKDKPAIYSCAYNKLGTLKGIATITGNLSCEGNRLSNPKEIAELAVTGNINATLNMGLDGHAEKYDSVDTFRKALESSSKKNFTNGVAKSIQPSANGSHAAAHERAHAKVEHHRKKITPRNIFEMTDIDAWVEKVIQGSPLSARNEFNDSHNLIDHARRAWLKAYKEHPAEIEASTVKLASAYTDTLLDRNLGATQCLANAHEDVRALKEGMKNVNTLSL